MRSDIFIPLVCVFVVAGSGAVAVTPARKASPKATPRAVSLEVKPEAPAKEAAKEVLVTTPAQEAALEESSLELPPVLDVEGSQTAEAHGLYEEVIDGGFGYESEVTGLIHVEEAAPQAEAFVDEESDEIVSLSHHAVVVGESFSLGVSESAHPADTPAGLERVAAFAPLTFRHDVIPPVYKRLGLEVGVSYGLGSALNAVKPGSRERGSGKMTGSERTAGGILAGRYILLNRLDGSSFAGLRLGCRLDDVRGEWSVAGWDWMITSKGLRVGGFAGGYVEPVRGVELVGSVGYSSLDRTLELKREGKPDRTWKVPAGGIDYAIGARVEAVQSVWVDAAYESAPAYAVGRVGLTFVL